MSNICRKPNGFWSCCFRFSFCPSNWPAKQLSQPTSPNTQLLKLMHEVQCMSRNSEMIDFSIYELQSPCFFNMFCHTGFTESYEIKKNNTKQDQQLKQIINHKLKHDLPNRKHQMCARSPVEVHLLFLNCFLAQCFVTPEIKNYMFR